MPLPSLCHSLSLPRIYEAWAKAFPSYAKVLVRPSSPAQPSRAHPNPSSSVQPSPQPKPWCGPCQSFAKGLFFCAGFRGAVCGPQTAPFLVRFWPVWGRRAAAFGCFEGTIFGSFPAAEDRPSRAKRQASQAQPSSAAQRPAQPSPAQPASPSTPQPSQLSPAQLSSTQLSPTPYCVPCFLVRSSPAHSPSLGVGRAKALPKAFFYWIQRCRLRPPDGSVFGPFLARLGPPCRCVWLF